MKKFLILFIVLFVSFLYAADSTAVIAATVENANIDKQSTPGSDIIRHTVFDNTEDTGDTIAVDDFLIVGPFPLNFGGTNQPNHKSLNLVGTNLAAGDSLAVFYQLAATNSILDTSSRWKALGDTIMPLLGPLQTTLDVSTVAAHYIWLRFNNFTASAVIVPDYQWLYFRKNQDYTKK